MGLKKGLPPLSWARGEGVGMSYHKKIPKPETTEISETLVPGSGDQLTREQ